METNPASPIPSPTPSLCHRHCSISQCCISVSYLCLNWPPLAQMHIVTHLSVHVQWAQRALLLSSSGVFFKHQDVDTRWLLEFLSHDGDMSSLLHSVLNPRQAAPTSVCLLLLSQLISSSLCHSEDVRDHGSENKGHWFLLLHDELSLSRWSSL